MIQPKGSGDMPALFDVGCLGRIGDVEALEDGRYNIVLEGETRFRLLRELDVTTRHVLAAFQMHFRPQRYDGEPDAQSASILHLFNVKN